MATPKVMKLLNQDAGLMECRVCGEMNSAQIAPGGQRYYRGSWQCPRGCRLDSATREPPTAND